MYSSISREAISRQGVAITIKERLFREAWVEPLRSLWIKKALTITVISRRRLAMMKFSIKLAPLASPVVMRLKGRKSHP